MPSQKRIKKQTMLEMWKRYYPNQKIGESITTHDDPSIATTPREPQLANINSTDLQEHQRFHSFVLNDFPPFALAITII